MKNFDQFLNEMASDTLSSMISAILSKTTDDTERESYKKGLLNKVKSGKIKIEEIENNSIWNDPKFQSSKDNFITKLKSATSGDVNNKEKTEEKPVEQSNLPAINYGDLINALKDAPKVYDFYKNALVKLKEGNTDVAIFDQIPSLEGWADLDDQKKKMIGDNIKTMKALKADNQESALVKMGETALAVIEKETQPQEESNLLKKLKDLALKTVQTQPVQTQ